MYHSKYGENQYAQQIGQPIETRHGKQRALEIYSRHDQVTIGQKKT